MKFKSSSSPASSRAPGTVETLIGRQTELVGDLNFSGGLHLDGSIKGNVGGTAGKSAHLSVSESGVIEGNVSVTGLVLNGSVTGDVHCSESVMLGAKARVLGNVFYKVLEMQAGAQVNGQVVHESMQGLVALQHKPAALAELSNGSTIVTAHDHHDHAPVEAMN